MNEENEIRGSIAEIIARFQKKKLVSAVGALTTDRISNEWIMADNSLQI